MPFKKGESGNPHGRSSVGAALARLIRGGTQDGYTLVRYCLDVLEGTVGEPVTEIQVDPATGERRVKVVGFVPASIKDRTRCAEILLERMAGKPRQEVDIDLNSNVPAALNINVGTTPLAGMTDDEFRQLGELLSRAAARAVPAGAGSKASAAVIEVQPTPAHGASAALPGGAPDGETER